MTIGDEKVVAWRDVIVPSHASSDQLYNWNAEAVSRDEAESKIAALHSAYAELAAEKQRLYEQFVEIRNRNVELIGLREAAESQLAELRGRLLVLADGWEGRECSDELRTLAAADGATGETK